MRGAVRTGDSRGERWQSSLGRPPPQLSVWIRVQPQGRLGIRVWSLELDLQGPSRERVGYRLGWAPSPSGVKEFFRWLQHRPADQWADTGYLQAGREAHPGGHMGTQHCPQGLAKFHAQGSGTSSRACSMEALFSHVWVLQGCGFGGR